MANDVTKIARLWDRQWVVSDPTVTSVLDDRFTSEAYRRIERYLPRPGARILEAGCGTGRFSALLGNRFPEARLTAVDVSGPSVEAARAIAEGMGATNVTCLPASIFELPFLDASFDYVFNEGVILLFDPATEYSYARAFREMVRVTKPGGRVLVTVANWYCLPHTLYKAALAMRGKAYEYGYEKSFRHGTLRALARQEGLVNIRLDGLYPAYGFSRLASRVRGRWLKWACASLARIADRVDGPKVSEFVGFQLVLVADKPSSS